MKVNELKEFTNRGPYEIGREIIVHKQKRIDTTLHNKNYDKFLESLFRKPYKIIKVGPGVAHRPDLISNEFYGTPLLFWAILAANDLTDPFEGLNAGDLIKVISL